MSQESANALVNYLLRHGPNDAGDAFKAGYLEGHVDGQAADRQRIAELEAALLPYSICEGDGGIYNNDPRPARKALKGDAK